MRVQGILKQAS